MRVSFHPAGHVLGSAQVRVEGRDGVWVVSGDYKRAADPTCAPFEPVRCDTFITESTFGLPIYRWDPAGSVIADIMAWWNANRDASLTSVLFCYTLGKAQRVLAELTRVTDRPVYVHGMMLGMIEAYREAGVAMLPVVPVIERARGSRSSAASFAGELVLAPLSARGTPWMRRLGDVSDAFASGLMRVRGVRRQRAFDRGFVLSDHADWPALLRDDRGDRRATRPRHARPQRAARALPRGARARQRRHPHGVGRRAGRAEAVRLALRRDRSDDLDQREGRGDGAVFPAAPPADAAWAVFFLTGRRLKRLVPSAAIRDWTLAATGLDDWLLERVLRGGRRRRRDRRARAGSGRGGSR